MTSKNGKYFQMIFFSWGVIAGARLARISPTARDALSRKWKQAAAVAAECNHAGPESEKPGREKERV
jgi:hypothetical protein